MNGIRGYILSIVAAAVFCGLLRSLVPGKGAAASVLRLTSGIFLAFTVIQPVARIRLEELPAIAAPYLAEGEAASAYGEKIAAEALGDIITAQTEAYILDKARSLNAELIVTVSVTDDAVPVPASVRLEGSITPYGKTQLQAVLWEELGIAKENQLWIG